jgi:hypothetical protein
MILRVITRVFLPLIATLTIGGCALALVDSNATSATQALYTKLQNAQGNYIYFGQEGFSRYMWADKPDSFLIISFS